MPMLEGKTAIIVGASAGIGRATALLFAREGAAVVINGRDPERLADVAQEIADAGGHALAVAGDAALEATHRSLIDAALEAFGGLDIAVNNTGYVGTPAPLAEIDPEAWQHTMDMNVGTAFLGARS